MSVNPKRNVSLLVLSTALAGFSLASIINFTTPENASLGTLAFFYASLLLLSLGIFTLSGLAIRQKTDPGHYLVNLSNSFRQALLISFLIVVSFWLLSQKILYWWVEATLILFLAAIEAFLNLKV